MGRSTCYKVLRKTLRYLIGQPFFERKKERCGTYLVRAFRLGDFSNFALRSTTRDRQPGRLRIELARAAKRVVARDRDAEVTDWSRIARCAYD